MFDTIILAGLYLSVIVRYWEISSGVLIAAEGAPLATTEVVCTPI